MFRRKTIIPNLAFALIDVFWLAVVSSAAQPAPSADDSWAVFEAGASKQFGDAGAQAAAFLRMNHPDRDAAIRSELLLENLRYAIEARQVFGWARHLSDELFLNDVLPYAVLEIGRASCRERV